MKMKKMIFIFLMFILCQFFMINVSASSATLVLRGNRYEMSLKLKSVNGTDGITYMKARLVYDSQKIWCSGTAIYNSNGVNIQPYGYCAEYIVFGNEHFYVGSPMLLTNVDIYSISLMPVVNKGSTKIKFEIIEARDNKGKLVDVYCPPLTINLSNNVFSVNTKISTSPTVSAKSSNASLKKLDIENYDIDFNKEKYNYEINIANNITSLNIITEKDHSKASIKVVGNEDFKVGTNFVEIIITAENGSKKTYNIKVIREGNQNLKELTIEGIALDFNPDILDYKISIPFEQTKVNVSAVTEDNTSIYEVKNNENIAEGISVVEIIVTSEDGIAKTYNIEVNRLLEVKKENYKDILIAIISVATLLILSFIIYLVFKKKKQINKNRVI